MEDKKGKEGGKKRRTRGGREGGAGVGARGIGVEEGGEEKHGETSLVAADQSSTFFHLFGRLAVITSLITGSKNWKKERGERDRGEGGGEGRREVWRPPCYRLSPTDDQ